MSQSQQIAHLAMKLKAVADPHYAWDMSKKSREITRQIPPKDWDYVAEATASILGTTYTYKKTGVTAEGDEAKPQHRAPLRPIQLRLGTAANYLMVGMFDHSNMYMALNFVCNKLSTYRLTQLISEHHKLRPVGEAEFFDVSEPPALPLEEWEEANQFNGWEHTNDERLTPESLKTLFDKTDDDNLKRVAFYLCNQLPERYLRVFLRNNKRVRPIAQQHFGVLA